MTATKITARMLLLTHYVKRCAELNPIEPIDTHFPPTMEELKQLVAYLEKQKVQPRLVGSIAALFYAGVENFRPTKDADVFVSRIPPVMPGWTKDRESIAVTSWKSPSGGYVDFLVGGHEFSDKYRAPRMISVQPESASTALPMASFFDLFKLKLATMRDKDILDLVAMVRGHGKLPTEKELGKLNRTQKENLAFVGTWLKHRPHGKYGE